MVDKLCKNCTRWEKHSKEDSYLGKNRGKCSSPKFIDVSQEGGASQKDNDTLEYTDYESYQADFTTGENFGCIHFEVKQ